MTVMTCAVARELAPEFALDALTASERSEMLSHLDTCVRCQAFVDSFTEVVDALPQLAPEIEPPAGFERRVRLAMGERHRRSVRRRVAVLAATAAAAAILSVGVVRIVDAGRGDATEVAPPQQSVAMRSDGVRVGSVTVSGHEKVSLAVTVDYAVPDGAYDLELRQAHATQRLGHLAVSGGYGEWFGTATLPRGDDATLAMVDVAGHDVCHAGLAPLVSS
jgi:anti-sigma factor RsiW